MKFITYDILNKKLKQLTDQKVKNPISKKQNIAYSSCGFPVEHYSIGNGKKHLIVMAGTHGTEIIGIDFVLTLMEKISKGEGYFKNFDANELTIDFIPCQNPEGHIIVSEVLKSYIQNLNEDEFERLSKEYYLNYVKDDRLYKFINQSLKPEKKEQFWQQFRFKNIYKEEIGSFIDDNKLWQQLVDAKIIQNLDDFIPTKKFHHQMFPKINYNLIEEKDKRYLLLKAKVKSIMETKYGNYTFPKESLIDWRSNGSGVDLNKNNPHNVKLKNAEKKKNNYKHLFGTMRFNTLMREVPGPQGINCLNNFTFENENLGLLKLIKKLEKNYSLLGLLSYHSAGGVIYCKTTDYNEIKDENKAKKIKQIDKYNTSLALIYQKYTDYKLMPFTQDSAGTGDMLRHLIPGVLLIELSKMGGNPLGPYGDKENYKKVINDNLKGFYEILKVMNKLKIRR